MSTDLLKIQSKAPTRVDLAGGTLDIWPLYLMLRHPLTINLGISLFAEVTLEEQSPAERSGDDCVVLRSQDQGAELKLPWSAIETASAPPALDLHLKLFRYYQSRAHRAPHGTLILTTRAQSPAGAGLGGSSTLGIALAGALAEWSGHTREDLVEVVRDTETTVIRVPAGLQDYYGALNGGLQVLRWRESRHESERLAPSLLAEVEKRLLLFYSGQSRNSGINNWVLFKNFIDNENDVRNKFEAIGAATWRLESSLRASDWDGVGRAILDEWEVRRGLAAGITTPEIDRAFELARKEGATAHKICGAGGGGCFFVYVPSADPELKKRIVQKVTDLGVRSLPFQAIPQGLEVKVARA